MSSAASVANCPAASITGGSPRLCSPSSSHNGSFASISKRKNSLLTANNNNNNNIGSSNNENTLEAVQAEGALRPAPSKAVVQPGPQVQQVDHQLHEASTGLSQQNQQRLKRAAGRQLTCDKELELLERENSELKTRTRKQQLEIDEKNEIISVLRDELETSKEQGDKLQRDNLQLLKDSKRASFLQDENDFLQDKVGKVESLESEIGRLKEKLAELEFLKLRIVELQEDRQKAQDEAAQFEERCKRAEEKLTRVVELEAELNKWKLFSHELEAERNSIQSKLLTSIEQETKLQSTNKKVEDEVIRLRTLIKKYEEQRDEQQASNSLNIIDLKGASIDGSTTSVSCGLSSPQTEDQLLSHLLDTSIQFELDKQLEKEVNEENRNLKQKLNQTEDQLNQLEMANQVIRDELTSNRKLISELRQDLACEKSVALKLNNQLLCFTKQIKNLDKNYLHSRASEKSIIVKPVSDTTAKLLHIAEQQQTPQDTKLTHTPAIGCNNFQQEQGSSLSNRTPSPITKHDDLLFESKKMVLPCNSSSGVLHNCTGQIKCVKPEKSDNELELVRDTVDSLTSIEEQKKNSPALYHNNSEHSKLSELGVEEQSFKKDTFFENDGVVVKTSSLDVNSGRLSAEKATGEDEATAQVPVKATGSANGVEKNQEESAGALRQSVGKSSESGLNLFKTNGPLIEELDERSTKNSTSGTAIAAGLVDQEELKSNQKPDRVNIDQSLSFQPNNNNNSKLNLTSLSSSSAINRSQNSSPAAVVTYYGHDSGFQSINHDLNQSSTVKPDACKTTTSELPVAKLTATSISHTLNPVVEPATKLYSANQAAAITNAGSSTPDSFKKLRSITPPTKPDNKEKSLLADTDNSHESQVEFDLITQQKQRQKPVISESINELLLPDTKSSFDYNGTQQQSTSLSSVGKHSSNDHPLEPPPKLSDIEHSVPNKQSSDIAAKEAGTTTKQTFLRNSKSSRSVNFGSSRPSGYLDRIRASLTATTTTSSFSQQQEQLSKSSRIGLPTKTAELHQAKSDELPHSLNCMLKHLHSERCFLNHHHHHHNIEQRRLMTGELEHPAVLNSSRQLNALIDPISQQRVMLNMMQQQQRVLAQTDLDQTTDGVTFENLTPEQQRQRIELLHHQHYYHHLQHMHQLHQIHHMHLHHHHLHHQYQQQVNIKHHHQQQKYDTNGSSGTTLEQQQKKLPASNQLQSPQQQHISHHQQQPLKESINGVCIQSAPQTARICEPIYTGGSQFQASAMSNFDGLYANVMSDGMQSINQQAHQQLYHHKNNKLVNGDTGREQANCSVKSSPRQLGTARMSPIKCQQHSSSSTNNNSPNYMLPQIDEVNGLPSFDRHTHAPVAQLRLHHPKEKQLVGGGSPLRANSADAKRHTGSASSTSPTSSGSPNLSPSSASSSSSLNSLSISSAPLTRSAMRRTTTDSNHNRRQFSVERELTGPTPLTATLSRVGSCRLKQPNELGSRIFYQHADNNSVGMQVPVKCQQPSMRTSKILNISQQSQQHQLSPQPLPQSQTPKSVAQKTSQESKFIRGLTGGAEKKLVNNLGNIRLSDSLAFTSLREPKKFSDKILSKLSTATTKASNSSQHRLNTSVGPAGSKSAASTEKQKRLSVGDAPSSQDMSNSGNKSSVWFEYGCI